MTERREVMLAGSLLSYLVAGADDAPPMVLLHALGDQAEKWQPVLDQFAADYRVFALDLSGHGQSGRRSNYSFGAYADEVVGFLDALELDRVVLVGHSMGGVTAFLVAIQQPDRIRRLVIEDVAPPRPRDRPIPERPESELDFDWELVPDIIGQVNRGEPDIWSDLEAITPPTLLIGGGPESHIPQDHLEEACSLIPTCDLITIPAGHYVHQSRPEDFARTVLNWL